MATTTSAKSRLGKNLDRIAEMNADTGRLSDEWWEALQSYGT